MKQYISHSDIAFNILVDGKRRHVRFDAISGGGSVFSTADQKEIVALEKHPDYNTLFRLNASSETKAAQSPVDSTASTPAPESGPDDQEENPALNAPTQASESGPNDLGESPALKVYNGVTSCSEAKSALKEIGVPSTALKNKAGILEAAQANNVSFPDLK